MNTSQANQANQTKSEMQLQLQRNRQIAQDALGGLDHHVDTARIDEPTVAQNTLISYTNVTRICHRDSPVVHDGTCIVSGKAIVIPGMTGDNL